jgi:HEAT repeat protein
MSMASSRTNNPEGDDRSALSDPATSAVADLASPNGIVRQRARRSLVDRGPIIVPRLQEALYSPDWRVRWEAAKALTEIADPSAADALVAAMEDETAGVRWIAAEGVIALGHRGLVPLLHALIRNADSAWFRLGAHHVLRGIEGRGLDPYVAPVLEALSSAQPAMTVPLAAEEAIGRLREASGEHS